MGMIAWMLQVRGVRAYMRVFVWVGCVRVYVDRCEGVRVCSMNIGVGFGSQVFCICYLDSQLFAASRCAHILFLNTSLYSHWSIRLEVLR